MGNFLGLYSMNPGKPVASDSHVNPSKLKNMNGDEDKPLTSSKAKASKNGDVTLLTSESIPLNDSADGEDFSATNNTAYHQRTQPKVYKRRWVMLLLFTSYSFTNAYQWIHLNIIGNIVMNYYNSSLPDSQYQQQVTIDWLSMVYMLAYVPLIFPVTWLLDKRGLRVVGLAATFLNALGAWIKCAAVNPERFALIMVAQTLCATGQVFILGMPARLAAVWFGHNQVSTATAIGVFGNQLGVAAGFLIPPLIVPDVEDLDVIGKHLSYMFYGAAAVTTLQFILVLFVFRAGPPVPPSQAQAVAVKASCRVNYIHSLKRLFRNRGFLLLMVTYGINTGSYYAIGTLLSPVILHYFPGQQEKAGLIGLTLVVAGVFGSVLAGVWLDRTKLFKSTTVFIYFMSFVGMIMFTFTLRLGKIWIGFLCSGTLGFFMTGYLPVGFEFAAEITYPESEGTSSGLLNASAQVFGIALTLGMGAVMNEFGNLYANLAVSVALFVGTIATVMIRSELRRQRAGLEICRHEIQIDTPKAGRLDLRKEEEDINAGDGSSRLVPEHDDDEHPTSNITL